MIVNSGEVKRQYFPKRREISPQPMRLAAFDWPARSKPPAMATSARLSGFSKSAQTPQTLKALQKSTNQRSFLTSKLSLTPQETFRGAPIVGTSMKRRKKVQYVVLLSFVVSCGLIAGPADAATVLSGPVPVTHGEGDDDGGDDGGGGVLPEINLDMEFRFSTLYGFQSVSTILDRDIGKPGQYRIFLDLVSPLQFDNPFDEDDSGDEDVSEEDDWKDTSLEFGLLIDPPASVNWLPDYGPFIRIPIDQPEDSEGGIRAIYEVESDRYKIETYGEYIYEVESGDFKTNLGLGLTLYLSASLDCESKLGPGGSPAGTGCYDRIDATVTTSPVPLAGSGVFILSGLLAFFGFSRTRKQRMTA